MAEIGSDIHPYRGLPSNTVWWAVASELLQHCCFQRLIPEQNFELHSEIVSLKPLKQMAAARKLLWNRAG
jgi:hypothetical protein